MTAATRAATARMRLTEGTGPHHVRPHHAVKPRGYCSHRRKLR
jgi:hypothetical protein